MRIVIETVENSELRYPTLGDWFYTEEEEGGTWHIKVAKFWGDDERYKDMMPIRENYEWLIAIHELIELFLCQAFSITQQDVDKFDMETAADDDEPGDNPDAPYYEEHQTATAVEILVAQAAAISLRDYLETCNEKYNEIKRERVKSNG